MDKLTENVTKKFIGTRARQAGGMEKYAENNRDSIFLSWKYTIDGKVLPIDDIQKYYKWFSEELEDDLQAISDKIKSYNVEYSDGRPGDGMIRAGNKKFFFKDSAFINLEDLHEVRLNLEELEAFLKGLGFDIY